VWCAGAWLNKLASGDQHQPVCVVSECGAGAWLNKLASGDQH